MSEPTPEAMVAELAAAMAVTPSALREKTMTVGMALKLAALTRAQSLETAVREITLAIRDADTTRGKVEDKRSVRRNRNRLAVLCMGLLLSVLWPTIMLRLFHSTLGTVWTTAVANTGDMLVTAYALWRHY